MLQNLHIQNYAIIDEINIEFSNQLNILTGETGAGKSIVMGALSLILGERADISVLVDVNKKSVIEGSFLIDNKFDVLSFLKQTDLDNNNNLVLRREIASNGKSRAFINDTPVNLQQLKQLTSLLVDLHQQFDTLELGQSNFQREVVDALADNQENNSVYIGIYKDWMNTKKELLQLREQQQSFQKELDYNQFLFDELDELNLKENELEDLDAELKVLSNSEAIKESLTNAYEILNEGEQPMVIALKQIFQQLQHHSSIYRNLLPIVDRIKSTQIELDDIASEIEHINHSIVFDENRITIINDKLSLGYKLLKKHHVTTTKELLIIQTELKKKLQAILYIDEKINKTAEAEKFLLEKAKHQATIISTKRHQQIKFIEENVNALLHKVGMPNALIKVTITDINLNEFGKDEIEFLFDANKSNKFEPIKKVASGGELSRLMLCIKSLVAEKIDLPTLIFDEIDSGISGEAAKQVAIIMQNLAKNRQIICITHQPQIAAKANHHLYVYKHSNKGKITTSIKLLNANEKIETIAKMLSGENPSEAALTSAKEMMK